MLSLLDVAGALVTIDAIGCRREIAAEVRRGEGDYVLAVKRNQPTLYERVEAAIDVASEGDAEDFEGHVTSEKGHGRQEERTDAVVPAPESIDPEGQWCDLEAIAIATSERIDGRGHHSLESRYYIPSRVLTAQESAEAVRGHWGSRTVCIGDSMSASARTDAGCVGIMRRRTGA